ncbi:MAG: 30S ribosomal protein S17 [Candidatus Omnitrophica bacterium]|jgi:small subunit ribosomal protein S17|nr:30S ribosomal protein S17 [Candidatus Omnitrophota bacterium]MDD5690998.1 30S ribosomal protein S17 [Candidatus Omnitrophota bacterium]
MGKQKEFTGVVVSDKMQKTVVVKTMHLSRHTKYSKTIRMHNKFKAHDEKGIAKSGDIVRIVESRPLSKDKRFIVKEVVKKFHEAKIAAPEEIL